MGYNSSYTIPPGPWNLTKGLHNQKRSSKNELQKVQELGSNKSNIKRVISKSNIKEVQNPNHSQGGSSSQKDPFPSLTDNSTPLESKIQTSSKTEPTPPDNDFNQKLIKVLDEDPEKVPNLIYEDVINNGLWENEYYLYILKYITDELKNHGRQEDILFKVRSRYKAAQTKLTEGLS